jgi:quinol-cytochrome oxidoreductase complex cytochrome b subunit
MMKNIGLILFMCGWIALTLFGIYQGILESQSMIFSIAFSLLWFGFFILLVLAITRRLRESKHDPYKDVEV